MSAAIDEEDSVDVGVHVRTGLDLAVQCALESADQVHLELIRISDDFGINYIRQSVLEFTSRSRVRLGKDRGRAYAGLGTVL